MTRTRNELFLLKEMLPIWQKYADGFIFLDDRSTDGTYEYLIENKEKYNILSILKNDLNDEDLSIESNERQVLFDEAFKYSGKILCLDTDEYLDGTMSKEQLEDILDQAKNTLIHLQWIQYTGINEIRVDGPWGMNYKDRLGSYDHRALFKPAQMHSEHMPRPGNEAMIPVPHLFIAHLQWLDKKTVAVKQYFWKITDYVNHKEFGVEVTPSSAYDLSVNNFNWQYSNFIFPLKVNKDIYSEHTIEDSYKYKFIKEKVKKYNIPNLNDWGMNIHE
jgi:hypothetical protein